MHVYVLSKILLYQSIEILVLAGSGIQICSLITPVNLGRSTRLRTQLPRPVMSFFYLTMIVFIVDLCICLLILDTI